MVFKETPSEVVELGPKEFAYKCVFQKIEPDTQRRWKRGEKYYKERCTQYRPGICGMCEYATFDHLCYWGFE